MTSRFGWRRGAYKIAIVSGMKDRHGWVNDGVVAVYRAGRDQWRLDHVPSGYGLPGYFETRENAMRAAETISGQIKGFAKIKPSKRACRDVRGILQSFAEFHPVFDPLT